MFSTRKQVVSHWTNRSVMLGVTLAGLAGFGCASDAPRQEQAAMTVPTDPAIERRDRQWQEARVEAYYPQGAVTSGPPRQIWTTRERLPYFGNVIVDPLAFAVNTLYLPISYIREPFAVQRSQGIEIEPTYTAVSPLDMAEPPPSDTGSNTADSNADNVAQPPAPQDQTGTPPVETPPPAPAETPAPAPSQLEAPADNGNEAS